MKIGATKHYEVVLPDTIVRDLTEAGLIETLSQLIDTCVEYTHCGEVGKTMYLTKYVIEGDGPRRESEPMWGNYNDVMVDGEGTQVLFEFDRWDAQETDFDYDIVEV
jgi:hypothetical protein